MKNDNKAIIEFLSDRDPAFCKIGNVYHAEKAFIVKSVIEWCSDRRKSGQLTEKQVGACIKTVRRFLNNELDIFWDDGTIIISELPGGDNEPTKEF